MIKEVVEVLDMIERDGYEAYLVGGFPRDYYMGEISSDYDICTNAHPEIIKNIFDCILQENYGSVEVRYKEIIFEITTFRIESGYSAVRSPNISYSECLEEDLQRRKRVPTGELDEFGKMIMKWADE